MTTEGMLDRTAIRLTLKVCSVEKIINCERNQGMPDLPYSTKYPQHLFGYKVCPKL